MAIREVIRKRKTFISWLDSEITAFVVLIYGLFSIYITLTEVISIHHLSRLTHFTLDLPLFVGLSLVYLSTLLRRLKRTAWFASILVFVFYLGANLERLTDDIQAKDHITALLLLRLFLLPLLVITLLLINHKKYIVRSDIQGLRSSIFISLVILLITFSYGTIGFLALGESDFNQHLTIPAAMHYSVDQFNVTTNHPIVARTKKARLFQDSLGVISTLAVVYVVLSLFQPLRSRFTDQSNNRKYYQLLLNKQHDSRSEDFFKLWPLDKQYFFDSTRNSGLAFRVHRGTALILGGPNGKQAKFKQLLVEFQRVCNVNDWKPSVIHCPEDSIKLYEELGYSLQKIGQEAVVNLDKFNKDVANNKYFRNIKNKFSRAGYTYELLSPPHSPEIMARLSEISNIWLGHGNRSERGFALGYFSEAYLNNCLVGIAKDDQGIIQAFINIVPAEFDSEEATYDLLRYSEAAISNTNDFLLLNTINELASRSYVTFNLGLCPLSGLGEEGEAGNPNKLIDYVLSFAYHNGDRIYSFSGLYRFKNKYEPEWQDSFVAYQGGVRGFSKTMNAVMALMRQGAKHPSKRYI